MTERFEYKKNKVFDKLTKDIYSSRRTLCNVCNQLWNMVLRFEKHNQELVQRSINYEDKIDELKNENERLKQFNNEAIELIFDGVVEMHDGKRDYAETIFYKAIKLLKGDIK